MTLLQLNCSSTWYVSLLVNIFQFYNQLTLLVITKRSAKCCVTLLVLLFQTCLDEHIANPFHYFKMIDDFFDSLLFIAFNLVVKLFSIFGQNFLFIFEVYDF